MVAHVSHAQPSVAQTPAQIPVHPLGAISAASKDTLGAQLVVRGLSNGGVLVNDIARRRVLLFDASLGHFTVVMDSAGSGGSAIAAVVPSSSLIRALGDTTLYVDVASQSLLVLDGVGKVARVMALPKPQDAIYLALGAAYGAPGLDPKGRLIYRGVIVIPPKPQEPGSRLGFQLPEQPDSAPIVRADFDTRKLDTITTLKVFRPGAMSMTPDAEGNMTIKITINPMDTGDEWAMLSDGTIAIVRAHDYHIDWVDPDGARRSTPKMPFDWKRMTDEEKQFKIDSMKPEIDKAIANSPVRTIPTADGPRKLTIQYDFVALDKMPDYQPPISPGSIKPDFDGNLWIVPRTSLLAAQTGALVYDVVNRLGEITKRVQFPKGVALAGFGPGGAVYVTRTNGTASFLERAQVR